MTTHTHTDTSVYTHTHTHTTYTYCKLYLLYVAVCQGRAIKHELEFFLSSYLCSAAQTSRGKGLLSVYYALIALLSYHDNKASSLDGGWGGLRLGLDGVRGQGLWGCRGPVCA